MSRRKRTSDRCLCLPETLEQARSRITEGESIRSVARSLEMHEATLRKRLKNQHLPQAWEDIPLLKRWKQNYATISKILITCFMV